jgi:hypothetical protein
MNLPLSLTKRLICWLAIGAMIDNNVKAMARLADHHYILGEGKVAGKLTIARRNKGLEIKLSLRLKIELAASA